MAEQFSDGILYSEVRRIINEAISQLNTTRREWFSGYDGTRCYRGGKSWDLAVNGNRSEEPGTGSSWNDVGAAGSPGTITIASFITPSGSAITNSTTAFEWTWDSTKTPQSYTFNVYDDGAQIYSSPGSTQTAHTVVGLPLDGSNIRVDIVLTYSDATTDTLSKTFTASTGATPATWLAPIDSSNITGTTTTASWAYGSKTPQTWTLTVTNDATSTVINTYQGGTVAQQAVAGLPDNGNSVTMSLALTFTDTTTQTLSTTFISGAASAVPLVTFTAGATVSGEIAVSGGIALWSSSAANESGNAQANFATGSGPVQITSAGTVTEINMPNAGITTLNTGVGVAPTKFDINSNSGLSIAVGDVDWTSATFIDLKDVGLGVFLRDQDIPNPSAMTYFDASNAGGVTVTGPVIGQMASITRLCIQGTGLGLSDAHMAEAAYNQMTQFLVGYNQNVTITAATLAKIPNVQQFHCPNSNAVVTSAMFSSKPQLSNIDVSGGVIATVAEMDLVLGVIRNNAQTNGINGGFMSILSGNPAPTNGVANADIVYLQSTLGWSVT